MRIMVLAVCVWSLLLWPQEPVPDSSDDLPPLTRKQILETAQQICGHSWTCLSKNTIAPCVQPGPYRCDFTAGQTVHGIAYDWGGMDSPERFTQKLTQGHAAGSHSRDGSTSCTAGIDCSGFVSRCWSITREQLKYSTRDIRAISGRPKYNWYADMKPGDALVKPGDHIVLFAGYRSDHNPNVYEASGSAGKVIYNTGSTWSRFQNYYPLQYRNIVEE